MISIYSKPFSYNISPVASLKVSLMCNGNRDNDFNKLFSAEFLWIIGLCFFPWCNVLLIHCNICLLGHYLFYWVIVFITISIATVIIIIISTFIIIVSFEVSNFSFLFIYLFQFFLTFLNHIYRFLS